MSADRLLAAILETTDDAVFSHDAGGRVTTWNQAAERLFGHTVDEMIGRPCIELFAEHLRDEIEIVLETVLAGDRVTHFETEILRNDGMPVPISLSLCPVFDGHAMPMATVLVARDITEQRLAQATLAEVEARIRASEALANVGSWLWDRRTDTVQWSDEFHRIHGVGPRDFDGTLDAHLATVYPTTWTESAAAWRSRWRRVGPSTPSTGSCGPTRTCASSTSGPSR